MPDERESTERVDQRSRAPTFANLKLQTHNKVVKVFESQRGFSLLVCSLGCQIFGFGVLDFERGDRSRYAIAPSPAALVRAREEVLPGGAGGRIR